MTGATTLVTLASSGPSPLWYATRSTGTFALILLTLTVALGIAASGRYAPQRIARFEVSALHRNLSLLTLVFLVVHIATSVLDSYVNIGWTDAVIPLTSAYRTLWVGLGAVAFDLLLAVAATSAIRLRLGHRRWKAVHWLAYASWPVAMFHAAGTGTDTKLTLQLLLYAACLATVLAAVWWRLARAGNAAYRIRWWALSATALVPVALATFLAVGPLRSGWAARADGTPAATTSASTSTATTATTASSTTASSTTASASSTTTTSRALSASTPATHQAVLSAPAPSGPAGAAPEEGDAE